MSASRSAGERKGASQATTRAKGVRQAQEAAVQPHERTATGLGVADRWQAKEGHGLRVVGDDGHAGHERLDGGDHVLDERLVAKAKKRLGRAHAPTGAARQHDARDVVVARHGYAPLRAGDQVTIAVRLGDTPLTV